MSRWRYRDDAYPWQFSSFDTALLGQDVTFGRSWKGQMCPLLFSLPGEKQLRKGGLFWTTVTGNRVLHGRESTVTKPHLLRFLTTLIYFGIVPKFPPLYSLLLRDAPTHLTFDWRLTFRISLGSLPVCNP